MLAATLSGCASTGINQALNRLPVVGMITMTDSDVAIVHAGVQRVLKDPASAQFGFTAGGEAGDGTIRVCGKVNARNSFGGYTGDTLYTGILSRERKAFAVTGMGGTDTEDYSVMLMCQHMGLPSM